MLWSVFEQLDLLTFLADARAGGSGRATCCPRMLLTLWTYAISRGVGSAREIERLIEAEVVAVDGMRVRAAASAPSFRRETSLEELREQAALHLEVVLAQKDDPSLGARQKAAREAKARDFAARVDSALITVRELNEARRPGQKPARVSSTDPEARVMKMGDGGFRPGMNVQFATAGDAMGGPRTIVGVAVNNVGSDMGTLAPLVEQIEQRTGELPDQVLADANHANHAAITTLEQRGVAALVPVDDRTAASKSATPEIEAWKQRMSTPDAQKAYRARASLCELTNANARRKGMTQLLVRGIEKVTSVALLAAITHDVLAHAASLLA